MVRFGYLPGARVFYEGGPTELIKHGVLAEKYGFDSFWFGNHLRIYAGQFSETFIALTAVGLNTKHIFLSPWVIDPFGRHPAYIAQAITSLDLLTNGRIYLGIGAGEGINTIPYGIDFKKSLTRLKEAIEVIKLLWSSSQDKLVSYQGELFTLKDTYLSPRPLQKPHPPIYIGAFRRRTRKLVGEAGDGYLPWINTPETFKASLQDIETHARRVGRNIDDIDMTAFLPIAIPTSEAMRKAVEDYTRTALVITPEIAEYHGLTIFEQERLFISNCTWTVEDIKKIEENSLKIPESLIEKVSALGGVNDVIEKIDALIKCGATHIIIANLGSNLEDGMKILGEKVFPYFKN